MTENQLKLLQSEYTISKEVKQRNYHESWARIVREYQFDSKWDLMTFLESYLDTNVSEAAITSSSRLPMLNLLTRKLVALLALREPEFRLENRKPGDEAVAWVLEQFLRQLLDQIGFRHTSKQMVYDAALYGTVIGKVGYSSTFVYDETAWSEAIPKGAAQAEGMEDEPYGPLTEYGAGGSWQPGQPAFVRVRPHDVFLNPGARVLEEVRRIYHRSQRYLADVYHDSRYDKKVRQRVKGRSYGTESLESSYPTNLEEELEREVARVDVVECFDLSSRQFCVFVEHEDEPLKDWTPLPFQHVSCPYKFWTPIPNPENAWGIPYALLVLDPIQALNTVREASLKSVNREGKRVTYWKGGAITQEELFEKIVDSRDGQHHILDQWTDGSLDDLMKVVDFGGANPEIFRMENSFSEHVAYASQLDDPTRNAYNNSSRVTATEVQTRQNQQTINLDEMRDSFELFLEQCGADLCRIALEKWDQEEMIKVVGTDPRVWFWVPVERDRVQGEFSLRVHAGSTEPQDKATYRRQIVELTPRVLEIVQAINQEDAMVAQGMPAGPVDLVAMLKEILDTFDPRIADRILRRKDPVELLQRLVSQHHFDPTRIVVSEKMAELLEARAPFSPGLAPSPEVSQPAQPASFEEAHGVPKPGSPQFGRFPEDHHPGRVLSELHGGN